MASSYRVLYVDDEPSLLEITKLYLEKKAGFSVDCSLSGSEALSQIAAGHYDAVVSDYQMPEMDGITLLKKVREIHKTLPFILFTGRGREEVVIEAINNGVDFYLQKGGDPVAQYAELSHKIRTAVEQRTSERALKESGDRYRSLVDNMHDCVAVYQAVADGEDFVILEFNHAAEKTEQVTREEVVGQRVTRVFPGVQEFGILDVFRRVWRTGIPESFPVSLYQDNRISGWRDNFIFKLPSGEIVASYSDETARKQAEEAQQKSEEKYRLTLDATNDGIWDWNIPTGGTFFSYRWYTMIGYDPGELPATYATWRSLLHPDDAGRAEQKIQDHIGQKVESYSAEFRMRTKQGDWKWILARGKVVERDSGGNPIRMVGTHTDIDERKRIESELEQKNQELMASYEQLTASEEELKSQFDELSRIQKNLAKSEERYRVVADFTFDWEYWITPDGKFIYVSPSCERITGYRPEEFIHDPGLLVTITHPDDRGRVITHLSNVKSDVGEHNALEFRIITKNGEARWIGHECQPVYNTNSEYLGNRASNRDITERKEAEQKIAESSRFLATLIDTLPVPVFYKSADGKYLGCNPPFEEYIGIPRSELIGKTVYDISPKDLADKYRAADQEMIENPARQQYETQIMFADGSRHDVIFYKAPFYTSDGSVGGLIGTFIDITERKRIESDLERKNQELRGSYEQLTASEEELRHTVDELSRSEQELRKSEEQVRVKLESLLSPGGDIGTLELGDIINAQEFQSMMDDFYAITHMGIGIIDIQGNVLVGTGWQEICTGFHRVNPETCANCVESDTHLTEEVEPGTFRKYRCKNNMWDIVTPIIVGGNHVGNIFLGQFLYDDESIDIELFRAQAARYGFDEQAYLAALERVPRWSREKVDTLMTFYAKFAQMISSISYRNLQLARTVTERDSLLHSLQESERKYRTLGENIPEKIFVKDTALAYVSCNEHYARDLGIAAEGIAGKTDFDFFPRDLADHYHEVDRTVIASGTTRTIEERYIKDGRESWISMSKTPIRDDTGNITGILGIFHDITERKMAQDALDRATKKLNLLNSITFADIQNAVFSLSGYLDLEKTIPMNEKLQQYLKKEIGIVETIKESLTFSANYQSLGLKPPEWQDVLQSFLFGISHLDISKLSRRLDVEGMEIFADPLLENVFFTLAENVVMHGKTATEIVFRYHESPDGLTLIFEDNGAGIQNDMKEKIFDRRFEEKKGMGLFLAREILSITDMTIKETGEPGKGARFEIFVPNGVYRFTGSKGKNR